MTRTPLETRTVIPSPTTSTTTATKRDHRRRRARQGDDPADFDGDGVADLLDTDDDNDGVSDAVEIGEDPSNPVISVEVARITATLLSPHPDCAEHATCLSERLVVALPEWIDADSAGPLRRPTARWGGLRAT